MRHGLICALPLVLAGCFFYRGSPPDDPDPGPTDDSGTCFGWAPECYRYIHYDPSSCSYVEGCDWDPTGTTECDGAQRFCDTYFDRDGCMAQLGCAWRNPDGTVEQEPQGADCTGEAVPCGAYLTEEECNPQIGCGWTYDGYCEQGGEILGGRPWDPYPRSCGWYSTDGTGGFHPLASVEYCNQIPGCTGTLLP